MGPNIDGSVFFQQQPPDILGNVVKGLDAGYKLSDMSRQRAQQNQQLAFNQTLKSAYVPDENGNLQFDTSKLSDLAQIDPERAYGMQMQVKQQQLTAQKQQLENYHTMMGINAEMLNGVHDQPSYDNYVATANRYGIHDTMDPNGPPATYDPDWVAGHQQTSLSYQDKIANQLKQQQADAETAKAGAAVSEAGNKGQELKLQGQKFDVENQKNALNETMTELESARGNQAVQQAQMDHYAAQKVNSLVSQFKDPNQLNPNQVSLVASEVAKMAQGGSPTLDTLKEIRPETLRGSMATTAQKYLNEPTPANQGAFVDQLNNYAQSLDGDAKATIQNKVNRVLNVRQRTLNPSDYSSLKANYADKLMGEGTAPPPPKPGDVQDGHVFMGGNPASPGSWKAQ